jgi:hypothetical protein
LPVQYLALDLQPDQQKEQGHQPVIDPMLDRQRSQILVEQPLIAGGERRVGEDQRKQRRRH